MSDDGNDKKGEGAPESKEKSTSKKLEVDAVASDGVLSMLTSGISGQSNGDAPSNLRRQRSLSSHTREQFDSHSRQLKYNESRQSLEKWLVKTVELLKQLQHHAENGDVSHYPADADQTFTVLKLNLKMGSSVVDNAVAMSALLQSRLEQVIQHAHKLRERLEDTRSRVLVTGDLNAGKSSLCNALIRRQVLPVDQQPCTDVFCEVVDASKNSGVEEVHAIHIGKQLQYDPYDTNSGFEKFSLSQLTDLVHEHDKYSILKVYIKDPRPPELSLLNNGIVDICLIDAPGLNVDQIQTNEVFDRQEEIDLVIFVVSAENHFTQSSKEFVSDTAREKSLVFIVVNDFDKIRDQKRCKDRILGQVAGLAPETHKGAGDFVHFVSSNANGAPQPGPSNDPNDGGSGNYGPGSPDFDQLEASLRQFVLEKRSSSKLAPARTYLLNVLRDVEKLSVSNLSEAESQMKELEGELDKLGPSIDKTVAEYAQVSDQIDRDVERLTQALFTQSFEFLTQVVTEMGDTQVVKWPGLWNVFHYTRETRDILVNRIQDAVEKCEENARGVTVTAVDAVKQLGVLHVGEQPAFAKVFQKSAMFSRKRDNLNRQIIADISVIDLISFSSLLERPLPVLTTSKQALTSSASWSTISGALTAVSLLGGTQIALGSTALRTAISATNMSGVSPSRLVTPLAVFAAVAFGAWTIHELPRSIPRTLARKIAFEIDEIGYVRSNADRIASESRKVLRYPSQDVRAAFQSQLEARTRQRDDFERRVREASQSINIYGEIRSRALTLVDEVSNCSLAQID